MYRGPILVNKKGKVRPTYDAKPPLKSIQDAILKRVLNKAFFPTYLMGGIADPEHRRGYIRNAQHHAGAKLLFSEDVADFYPSIPSIRIKSIFLHIFRFAPPVAALLTALCTKDGRLAQGAKTSTALANLALYGTEWAVRNRLQQRGLRYSRFVDDVHASTTRRLSRSERTCVVADLRSMMIRSGFTPKRSKQSITSAGVRMEVHNLNVNTAASRGRANRNQLRLELFVLAKRAKSGDFTGDFDKLFGRVGSQIGSLKQTNPLPAAKLRREFDAIKKLRRGAALKRGSLNY